MQTTLEILKDIEKGIHVEKRHNHVVNVALNVEMLCNKIFWFNPNLNRLYKEKLLIAAYAHDLFKDQDKGSINQNNNSIEYLSFNNNSYIIPTNDMEYVRKNIDELTPYGMDYYFNSDAGYHALAAAIYIKKTFNIIDPDVLYPIMMHTCPIIDIYKDLDEIIRIMINILIIADKMDRCRRVAVCESKKYVSKHKKFKNIDIQKILNGESGYELNIDKTMLYIRYLVANNATDGIEARKAYQYFYERYKKSNPVFGKQNIDPYNIPIDKMIDKINNLG